MRTGTIIIGGGIAGLSAAWELHRRGEADFLLLEASPRLGGTIRTLRRDGFVAEAGPDSFLAAKPAAAELCRELGIERELVPALPGPRPVLPALPPLPPALPEDESLAAYLERCFGAERGAELARAVLGPMLAGVYGGRVEEWSARSWLAHRLPPGVAPSFVSLRAGMEQMVEALERQLPPAAIRRGCPVAACAPAAGGFQVRAGGETIAASRVIVTVPAWRAAELLAFDAELAAPLAAIPYAASVNLNLAYRAAPPLPAGHGFLAPPEAAPLLAGTFAHQKFPARAPAGGALVRLFYAAAGVRLPPPPYPAPDWTETTRSERAMPQYTVGHQARLDAISAALRRHPGLRLCGNAYTGVGLPDCIASGRAAARP